MILKNKNKKLFSKICFNLDKNQIEYRVGSAGGGNQWRQPDIRKFFKKNYFLNFLNTKHVHFYGMYIGNYPDLTIKDINHICKVINSSLL